MKIFHFLNQFICVSSLTEFLKEQNKLSVCTVYHKHYCYTVCSCHVTYAFQSESTLYSCLNVNAPLARLFRACFEQGVP